MFTAFNEKLKAYPKRTNWLRFYVSVWLPAAILLRSIYLFYFFAYTSSLMLTLIEVFELVFTIAVFAGMKKLTPSGYKTNIVFLWIYAILDIVGLPFIILFGYFFIVGTVGRFLAGMNIFLLITVLNSLPIWFIPTLIYLRRRKTLFTEKERENDQLDKTLEASEILLKTENRAD